MIVKDQQKTKKLVNGKFVISLMKKMVKDIMNFTSFGNIKKQ